MNLKLKRLVRTVSSEQYALFDLDQIDDEDGMPVTIGKLDLHYTTEGVYGTLLLWDAESGELGEEAREDFIYALLDEVSQPMGVPNEYVVEFFAPTLDQYNVFHNVGLAEDDDEDGGEYADSGADSNADSDSAHEASGHARNAGAATTSDASPAQAPDAEPEAETV